MYYFNTNMRGIALKVRFDSFRSVVNNGYVISSQCGGLLEDLEDDEDEREGKPIDWFLFKRGQTILVDDTGAQHLCTGKMDGWVELTEIVGIPVIMPEADGLDIDALIMEVADFVISIGTDLTTSGNYHVSFDDVIGAYPFITSGWLVSHAEEIARAIDVREESISETWIDKDGETPCGFDCNFGGAYCPNYEYDDEDE